MRVKTGTVNGNAVAELIDECVAAAGAFLQKNENSTAISDGDKDLISSLLGKVDGKTVVAEADPAELAEWIEDFVFC